MQAITSELFIVFAWIGFSANSFENQSQSIFIENIAPVSLAANTLPDSLQKPNFTNTLLYPILDSMIGAYDQYYLDAVAAKPNAAGRLREKLEAQSNKIFKLFNEISDTDFDNLINFIDKYGLYTEEKISQYYNALIESAQLEMKDSTAIEELNNK